MCTWAGYVGERDAAPILLEMAKRQEGLWSGYYSGLATQCDGELHWDKIVGDMDGLESRAGVTGFPGSLGLVHSRTNSGGDAAWGHPFLSDSGTLALVGQGSHGRFADSSARVALGNELLAAGRRFRSSTRGAIGQYPVLADGASVHTSEIVAQAAGAAYEKCGDPAEALRQAVCRAPLEAIYACIFRDRPDRIFVANVNQRLAIGRGASGTCIATSALAFPETIRWRGEVPANTLAVVGRDAVRFELLAPSADLPVEESCPPGLDEAFLTFVRAHPGASLAEAVDGALAPLFPSDRLVRRAAAGYGAMERLLAAGAVCAKTRTVTGANGQGTAPRTVLYAAA